jgi:hypothetical protein
MKRTIKLKQRICLYGLSLIIVLLLPCSIMAGNSKLYDLRSKMAEISLLREKIVERHSQTSNLCQKLKERMIELKNEIQKERRASKITSFQEAIDNPRINYNIKLIQKILAYLYRLNAKIQSLNIASEELAFLNQQAEDDLRILETLNDMKIENLMEQIDQASGKYNSEASKLVIEGDKTTLTPAEEIWNEMID